MTDSVALSVHEYHLMMQYVILDHWTDLGQAGVAAHCLVAAVLAVRVAVAHPAQRDAGTWNGME